MRLSSGGVLDLVEVGRAGAEVAPARDRCRALYTWWWRHDRIEEALQSGLTSVEVLAAKVAGPALACRVLVCGSPAVTTH